jgi:hypothetical protein
LVLNIPFGTNLLKKEKKLNKKNHPWFFLHCHACPWFVKLDVIISKYFTFEDVKPW